ncbi:hypothetical protein Ae201684P_021578 [Aphanomyces euteiches]|nr:hypothetical protein Ae201684P_021578 [Aphanomyces euteiches]
METTNIDNDLDLLHDLQLLIANDDQLQDDLANVCDLLLDDPSSSVDEDSIATNAVLNPPSTASPEHNHSTTTSATLPPRRQKTKEPRRFESTFIKAGVFDATKFILRAEIVPQPGNSGRFECANNIVLDAPFDTIATATWHILATKTPVELPEGVRQVAEVIDDHTIYMMQTDAYRRSYCNTIRKRYIEHDRHVIIQRTVQEDALMPHMNRGAVENKSDGVYAIAR